MGKYSSRPITDAEFVFAEELYVCGSVSNKKLWDEITTSVDKAKYVVLAQEILDRLKAAGFELVPCETKIKK